MISLSTPTITHTRRDLKESMCRSVGLRFSFSIITRYPLQLIWRSQTRRTSMSKCLMYMSVYLSLIHI